jgi:hypothetical protein
MSRPWCSTGGLRTLLLLLAVLLPSPARADDAVKQLTVGFTTLRLMREHGLISEAEYQSAMRDIGESIGQQADESTTLMLSRFSVTLYGFVEAYGIWDSTQSFNDLAGNNQVKRAGTYGGDNDRFTLGVRNSRIGLRIRAPEWHHIRTSAVLEMDFLGNQPAVGYDQGYKISEGSYFTSPGFRLRHGYFRIETPVIDVLIGQYWHLFGWQNLYHPNSTEIQGLPGQLYSRTPQLRLSKTLRNASVTFELAAAMMRSPERDSGIPEGQFGIRFAVNKWTATQTIGGTGTTVSPLSLAVTADVRYFELPLYASKPPSSPTVRKLGWGVAADIFLPLIPGRKGKMGNSLAINAEYAYGIGTGDLYTQMSSGVGNAALPPDALGNPQTFTPVVDPQFLDFTADGTAHLVQWQSYLVGLQYYFPRLNGRLWVSGNYSHTDSNNSKLLGPANAVRIAEDWANANLFGDVTPAVRFGVQYSWFLDHYADGVNAVNHRVQVSAFYMF